MPDPSRASGPAKTPTSPKRATWLTWLLRFFVWTTGLVLAGLASALIVVAGLWCSQKKVVAQRVLK